MPKKNFLNLIDFRLAYQRFDWHCKIESVDPVDVFFPEYLETYSCPYLFPGKGFFDIYI